MELISVIVPVYNIIEYLPRCVHSITSQTYKNLEIILVDDGSTDGTGALCDELAGEDDRIRVFHKENGGSSSARNLGIMHARGEYLGFVDSDDYIDSDMYERLYDGIVRYNVKVSQIGRDEIDASGNLLPNICEPPKEAVVIESADFLRELLMHRGDCSFCTKLLHRSILLTGSFLPDNQSRLAQKAGIQYKKDSAGEELFFPIGLLNEDFNLLVRILPKIERLVSLPGQTYHVFYRVGSNSRKADKEVFSRVFADCVDNADMVLDIVAEKYPALTDVAVRFGVFQRIEYLLHIPISQMTADNKKYKEIVAWMRKNWMKGLMNGHLTIKNKIYHTIFAVAPKFARKFHGDIKKLTAVIKNK